MASLINDSIINESNDISTKTKLIDKCEFLTKSGTKFNFIRTESCIFRDNLRLIDSKLDKILAKMLILSYEQNEKDIKKLLSLIIQDSTSELYYKKKTGEVYLLDLIYFKNIVDKYLINNIKLDSPSSTRYKMFEIYKENNKYYFKLNLQIRFK